MNSISNRDIVMVFTFCFKTQNNQSAIAIILTVLYHTHINYSAFYDEPNNEHKIKTIVEILTKIVIKIFYILFLSISIINIWYIRLLLRITKTYITQTVRSLL